MSWADEYVGLPFKRMGRTREGLDCWGLVRLVLLEKGNLELPAYNTDDPDGATIDLHSRVWPSIEIKDARALDVAILMNAVRIGKRWEYMPIHIGIFTSPGRILHVVEGKQSITQPAKELKIYKILRVTNAPAT